MRKTIARNYANCCAKILQKKEILNSTKSLDKLQSFSRLDVVDTNGGYAWLTYVNVTERTKPVPNAHSCMEESTVTEDNDQNLDARENSGDPTAGDKELLSAQQNAEDVIDQDGIHNVNSNGAPSDETPELKDSSGNDTTD